MSLPTRWHLHPTTTSSRIDNRLLPLRHLVIEVRLRIINRQILNPILLLVSHVMVHMCTRRQRYYVLLNQTGRRLSLSVLVDHLSTRLRFFKGVLVLDVAVDKLGNNTLIIYWNLAFPLIVLNGRLIMILHHPHIHVVVGRLLEHRLTLLRLVILWVGTLLWRKHEPAWATQKCCVVRHIKDRLKNLFHETKRLTLMCWYRKADLPTLLFIFKGSSMNIYVLNNELNCN